DHFQCGFKAAVFENSQDRTQLFTREEVLATDRILANDDELFACGKREPGPLRDVRCRARDRFNGSLPLRVPHDGLQFLLFFQTSEIAALLLKLINESVINGSFDEGIAVARTSRSMVM